MRHNPPDLFKQGVNVLMLIDRGIQNSNKGSKRWINKIITTDAHSWDIAAEKLIELQNHISNPEVRLYSSINPRNMRKAIKTFQHKQLDVMEEYEATFYSRINDSFCSCLMQPENRETSLFLLDCDSREPTELNRFTITNRDFVLHYTYPTPNGWHAIMEPFHPAFLKGYADITLKKDALMLVNWLDKE